MSGKRRKTKEEKELSKKREFTSVVCKLSRICKDSDLLAQIKSSCAVLKQVQVEGWHVANLHLLRCLNENVELPILDGTFFRRCCAGVLAQAEAWAQQRAANNATQSTRPRKRATTASTPAIASNDRVLDGREDSERKGTRGQPEDLHLSATLRIYRAERAEIPGYQPPSLENSGSSIGELGMQMFANARNMIVLQFRRRLHQYVRFRYAKEGEMQLPLKATKQLVSSCFSASVEDDVVVWDTTDVQEEMELREWLGMVPWEPVIATNLVHFLRKLYDMQTWIENYAQRHPNTKGLRVYSLIPHSTSFEAGYIKINASTLYGIHRRILRETGKKLLLVSPEERGRLALRDYVTQHRDSMLRRCFHISQFETGPRRFAFEVKTNGYGASILLTRPILVASTTTSFGKPKPTPPNGELDELTKGVASLPDGYSPAVLIGIDPGVRNLCTAVSVGRLPKRRRRRRRWLTTRGRRKRKKKNRRYQQGQTIHEIHTKEYRHLAGAKSFVFWVENLKKREPWYAGVIRAMPSFKTANFDLYRERLKFLWLHLGFLVAFSAEKSFLKWRFLRSRKRMAALDALARRIVPKASPLVCIAYGDWSNQDRIKGHPTSPVKGFKEALKRRATVLTVDEYRTSQLCSLCHRRLEWARLRYPNKKGEVVLKANRNVLRCAHSECKANFWSRDVNAARNILSILVSTLSGLGRPTAFERE
ncbi:hypothetical protein BBJ28_00018299 [Nothophytophthora sp. Chile5]|nr:hypothetical protein BBJ28_00018299 [Nothophytophthora sp. Chile5]